MRIQRAEPGRVGVDAAVAALAAGQHGVFSRRQAASVGATRSMIEHRLATGRWKLVARGVVVMGGAPTTWRRELLAAVLAWGPGTVASHRSAAAMAALAGHSPGPIELTVPRGRDRTGPGIVHRTVLERRDVCVVDAIPLTVPARTLIDLAAVVERDVVEEALDDALRRGLVTVARLRGRLRGDQRGRRGVAMMRALLEQRDPTAPPPDSVLETKVLRLIRRARLPEPVRQYRVRDLRRTIAVVDFAYPRALLAIEADGYRWHAGRARWARDRTRLTGLTRLGWRVVHVTWDDLAHPEPWLDAIRSIL